MLLVNQFSKIKNLQTRWVNVLKNENDFSGTILFSSFVLLLYGVGSLYFEEIYLSWIAIIIIDTYIFFLLFFSGIISSKKDNIDECRLIKNLQTKREKLLLFFPSRSTALFVIVFLLTAMITSFAGLYYIYKCEFSIENGTPKLQDTIDAIYFSFVTMATVGYGDISPQSGFTKKLVVLQICSSFLFLLGIFPLWISRISQFENNHTKPTQ